MTEEQVQKWERCALQLLQIGDPSGDIWRYDPVAEPNYKSAPQLSRRLGLGIDRCELLLTPEILPLEMPQKLWQRFGDAGWKRRKSRGVWGHASVFNQDGVTIRAFRFPSTRSKFRAENALPEPLTPCDFQIVLEFNPASLAESHNAESHDVSRIGKAVCALELWLKERFDLPLSLLQAPLRELHLTNDVKVWCPALEFAPGWKAKIELRARQQILRFLEWSHAPGARQSLSYTNQRRGRGPIESCIGLNRGTKTSQWVIYDKAQEYSDKNRALELDGGQIRIEWRLKSKRAIREKLGIQTAWELLASLQCHDPQLPEDVRQLLQEEMRFCLRVEFPEQDARKLLDEVPDLYAKFDQSFVRSFFEDEAPPKRELKLAPWLFHALQTRWQAKKWLRPHDAIWKRGVTGQFQNADWPVLCVFLNTLGASATRRSLQKSAPTKQEATRMWKKLARLRRGGPFNSQVSWLQWEADLFEQWELQARSKRLSIGKPPSGKRAGQHPVATPPPSSSLKRRRASQREQLKQRARVALETLSCCPPENQWVWHDLPEMGEAVHLYRELRALEQKLSKATDDQATDGRFRCTNEIKKQLAQAEDFFILELFPRCKNRYRRHKTKSENVELAPAKPTQIMGQ